MLDRQIRRYENRIVEEEKLSREALTPDGALAHMQVAMLYKSELALMRKRRSAAFGEMLADTW